MMESLFVRFVNTVDFHNIVCYHSWKDLKGMGFFRETYGTANSNEFSGQNDKFGSSSGCCSNASMYAKRIRRMAAV